MSSRVHATRPLALAVLAILFAQAAASAQASGQERSRSKKMLKELREDIEEYYYDPSFNGVDVEAEYQAALKEIEAAQNLTMAMAALAQFMNAFGDSHTYFVPPLRVEQVDYGFDMTFVGDTCFVVDVPEDGPGAEAGLEVGDAILHLARLRLERESFAELEYALYVMYPQPKLGLVVRSPNGEQRLVQVFTRVEKFPFHKIDFTNPNIVTFLRDMLRDEAESRAHITVDMGEVLVWKMPQFGEDELRLVRDVSKKARKGRALVLDLRDNAGGSIETLDRLISVLFPEPVRVGQVRTREGVEEVEVEPRRGDVFEGELVVLVNSRSASSSEILARLVQLEGRGTVIGDRTAGAVMTGRLEWHEVGFGRVWRYGAVVSTSDVIMPDGGRLEGSGVVPDEIILPSGLDLREGRDPAMARALELVGVEVGPVAAAEIYEEK